MDLDLQPMRDAVAKQQGVNASVKTLIAEYNKELTRIKGLPTVSPEVKAELDALIASSSSESDGLAADVAANPDPNPDD